MTVSGSREAARLSGRHVRASREAVRFRVHVPQEKVARWENARRAQRDRWETVRCVRTARQEIARCARRERQESVLCAQTVRWEIVRCVQRERQETVRYVRTVRWENARHVRTDSREAVRLVIPDRGARREEDVIRDRTDRDRAATEEKDAGMTSAHRS